MRLPYWTCLECSLKAEHGHSQMTSRLQAFILLTPGVLQLQSLHRMRSSATHTRRQQKRRNAKEHNLHLELLPGNIHPGVEEDT